MTSSLRNEALAGKRILISGGDSGLGAMMAEAFTGFGAQVYICGRRPEALADTAHAIAERTGRSPTPMICDIRSSDSVERMVDAIWADGGALTGLVNNAASNFLALTQDLSPRGFDAIAATVFHGTFYLTLACGKRWVAEGLPASVVSILVTWIWNGGPFTVPSAMSKAGINAMTKSLAVEWAPHRIRLNAIAPGPFPTPGATRRLHPAAADTGDAADHVPMGRVGAPHELTNLVTFLLADGCEYLTGQTIALDGADHLANGGNYSRLAALGDGDWQAVREQVTAADAVEKTRRGEE